MLYFGALKMLEQRPSFIFVFYGERGRAFDAALSFISFFHAPLNHSGSSFSSVFCVLAGAGFNVRRQDTANLRKLCRTAHQAVPASRAVCGRAQQTGQLALRLWSDELILLRDDDQDGYTRVAERGQLGRVQVVASCYRRLCGCGLNVAKRPPVVELGDPALAPELAHVASSVARVGLFQKVAREALGQ